MISLHDIPVTDFVDNHTIRLIAAAYVDEPALTPLADDAEALDIIEEVESLTSARGDLIGSLPAGVASEELLTAAHGHGWALVNAAFCHTRAAGSRFNGPERGAWYASHGPTATETAQSEVSWHLTRELSHVGRFENTTACQELLAGFVTQFHDLNPHSGDEVLSADPDIAYPSGQTLARAILRAGGNGIVYPSVRHTGGHCLAAFRPHLVQNVREGSTWLFSWAGRPAPTITRQ